MESLVRGGETKPPEGREKKAWHSHPEGVRSRGENKERTVVLEERPSSSSKREESVWPVCSPAHVEESNLGITAGPPRKRNPRLFGGRGGTALPGKNHKHNLGGGWCQVNRCKKISHPSAGFRKAKRREIKRKKKKKRKNPQKKNYAIKPASNQQGP